MNDTSDDEHGRDKVAHRADRVWGLTGTFSSAKTEKAKQIKSLALGGVADGARTHDNRNHNPGLYQLSYSHRECKIIAGRGRAQRACVS